MLSEVVVPVMDQTTETVLLARWLKQEGDVVRKGEVVCEIETEKATVEIEAGADGVLRKHLVGVGTRIPPRTVVALVGQPDEPLPDADPYYQTPQARVSPRPEKSAHTPVAPVEASSSRKEVRISPRARRLAEEHHVDIATLTGSGPEGRILEDDVRAVVERAASTPPTVAHDDTAVRVARAKVERVSLSWRSIPHFHMSVTADLSLVTRRQAEARQGITLTDYILLALAQTLPGYPALNGHWLNDSLTVIPELRLGLAIQTERGLVIAALRDVRRRDLASIADERAQVVQQAREGRLTASASAEPTFTLTNVGPGHIDAFSAIISPPQVAILAMGSVLPRPVVVGFEVVARPTATFTLGVDHRAMDGREVAAFLESLKTALES